MSLTTTAQFQAVAAATGRQPVWLVEIPAANRFLASRRVWLNGRYYDALLAPQGLPSLTRELLADDSPRVGGGTVKIVNPQLFSNLLNAVELSNQLVTIKLGFLGGVYADYVTLFEGPIDSTATAWQTFDLQLLDGSFRHHALLPAMAPSAFGGATNPADVIQAVITQHLPQLTVDAPTFAAFRAARAGWSFTGTVDAQQESRALLVRLAFQAQGRYLESPSGVAQLRPLERITAALATFTAGQLVPQSLRPWRSPVAQVYTDVYVHYNRTPGLGGPGDQAAYPAVVSATPEGTTHPTEPLQVLCGFAQEALNGARARLDYLADFISDVDTANRLLRFLALWKTQRRHGATFTTWLNAAHLDLMDAVRVPHALLPTRVQSRALEVIARQDQGHQLTFTVQEIDHPHWGSHAEHWEASQGVGTVRWAEHWEDDNALLTEGWEPTALVPTLLLAEDWAPTALTATLLQRELWPPTALTAAVLHAEAWEYY